MTGNDLAMDRVEKMKKLSLSIRLIDENETRYQVLNRGEPTTARREGLIHWIWIMGAHLRIFFPSTTTRKPLE